MAANIRIQDSRTTRSEPVAWRQAVAAWLQSHPRVKRVIYPALEGNPGHAIWKRDFGGAASLFSFVTKPASEEEITKFIDALQIFGIGSSWGGFESLAIAAHKEILRIRTATRWDPAEPVIRLHIGLEDPEDLIADLERGFAAMQGQ